MAGDRSARLGRACAAARGRLVVAADARDGRVVTRGWTHATAEDDESFIASLDALPLAVVLATDVSRRVRRRRPDRSGAARALAPGHGVFSTEGAVRIVREED